MKKFEEKKNTCSLYISQYEDRILYCPFNPLD